MENASLPKKYSDYQHIELVDGKINLSNNTLDKYSLAQEAVDSTVKSVLDAGCSLGGIGLKLLQENINITSLTLNNITLKELDTAKEIAQEAKINGEVTYSTENVLFIKDEFDLTLYFSLIHHLLRSREIGEILQTIDKQTKKYTVLEIPVKGDALLDMVVSDSKIEDAWNGRYKPLSSLNCLFREISKVFEIVSVEQMDYGAGNLCRFAFICKKKILTNQ